MNEKRKIMKKPRPYWIRQRDNPQLGTYYVAEGQMSETAAKKHSRPLYGTNTMHRFDTKEDYERRLNQLKLAGLLN
jgi:hypothetical protein